MSYTFNVPRIITTGDTISWNDNFPDLKSTDYTLTHLIRGTKSHLDVVSVPNNDGWVSAIASSASAALIPDRYWAQIVVFNDSERITLDTLELTVKPNFANLKNFDGRSDDEKELDAITQAIAVVAKGGVAEYEINGRRVRYRDMNELIRLRDRVRARIAKGQNKGKSKNCYVSFN